MDGLRHKAEAKRADAVKLLPSPNSRYHSMFMQSYIPCILSLSTENKNLRGGTLERGTRSVEVEVAVMVSIH